LILVQEAIHRAFVIGRIVGGALAPTLFHHRRAARGELAGGGLAVLPRFELDTVPPEYSSGELRTALAIYRSAQSGQWEKVW
jgi:hypothetical protein